MSMDKREFANGTCIVISYPWGLYRGGKAQCEDGRVRTLKRIAICADTFFSIPAAISYRGKTVSGFVTDGSATEPLRFVATGKYAKIFTAPTALE